MTKVVPYTPEEHRVLEKAGKDAYCSQKDAGKRLEQYVQQYPHLPQFKNYLSVYYHQRGEHEKAVLLNQETLRLHPDYLYARVGVATDLHQKRQWTEMLPLLGEKLELHALYPKRKFLCFRTNESLRCGGALPQCSR